MWTKVSLGNFTFQTVYGLVCIIAGSVISTYLDSHKSSAEFYRERIFLTTRNKTTIMADPDSIILAERDSSDNFTRVIADGGPNVHDPMFETLETPEQIWDAIERRKENYPSKIRSK